MLANKAERSDSSSSSGYDLVGSIDLQAAGSIPTPDFAKGELKRSLYLTCFCFPFFFSHKGLKVKLGKRVSGVVCDWYLDRLDNLAHL